MARVVVIENVEMAAHPLVARTPLLSIQIHRSSEQFLARLCLLKVLYIQVIGLREELVRRVHCLILSRHYQYSLDLSSTVLRA